MRFPTSAVRTALLLGASCATLSSSMAVQAQTWVHPGIVVRQAQLDATRAAYQAGNSVIVSQVNKAMASNYGSLTYTVQGPWPGGINQCGAFSTPNNGCSEADDDSNAAYVQALLWYITGNQTYANNAIKIINNVRQQLQRQGRVPDLYYLQSVDGGNHARPHLGEIQAGLGSRSSTPLLLTSRRRPAAI